MQELASGTVFAGHRIEALVGRGGMGVVYRARQLELDRIVALKIIAPELLADAAIRERFLGEARTAASIEHPNVIPLHYVGQEGEVAYIAMRYVDGFDLSKLVRRHGALAPTRAADIAAQLGAGLDAIHRAGYVHRDVKPANVLLAREEHVYVSDFGLAKRAISRGGATRTGQWVGTLDYASPEQIRGGRVDARADVYALGCVLYLMLTGLVPFDRDDDEAKLWAHLSEPPPVPSRVRPRSPPELDAVVARAMAKDPEERYPSAGDLGRAALVAAQGQTPTQPERMVARGAAAPEGAVSEPGLADEVSTLTAAGLVPPGSAATTPVEEPRSGWRIALSLALAVIAAGGAAAVFLVGGDGNAPVSPPPPKRAGAELPKVGGTIANVGERPNAIAVAGGDVWVASFRDRRLTRIDGVTGRKVDRATIVGHGVSDLAGAYAELWVASSRGREVLRIDARSGSVSARLRPSGEATAVEVGGREVWVVTRTAAPGGADTIQRYSRKTRRLLDSIPVGNGVAAISLGEAGLWVAHRRTPTVALLNPRTGKPTLTARLTFPAYAIDDGAGYLWASIRTDDSVARIDPRTSAVVTIAAGRRPTQLVVAAGRVFVASYADHTLVAIDPETSRPVGRPLPVGLNPYAVVADARHVWVTGVGTNTVTRVDYR